MKDIIDISFTISGRVKLDLARAMEDPWWETYSRGLNLNDEEGLKTAIRNYISAYLRNESLLSDNAPWTTGPPNIFGANIEFPGEEKLSEIGGTNG